MARFTLKSDPVRIAVVGDRRSRFPPQDSIETALAHSADALGVEIDVTWFATPTLEGSGVEQLADADAVWCAPGSPFLSLEGALAGIRFARERARPFLGTCAGFQHAVIEIARSLLGVGDAHHAEYGSAAAAPLFIDELLCSLVGQTMTVRLVDPAVRDLYGANVATEQYYCRFGLNESYASALAGAGLVVAAVDAADETTRIMRLAEHRFFYLTLFVPQTSSTPERPHPLVTGYVAAALLERSDHSRVAPHRA